MKSKPTFEFDQDQLDAIELIVRAAKPEGLGGVLNASDTGAGKTAVSCESVHRLSANTVLVIAPLNTLDAWAENLEMYTTLPVFLIDSTGQGIANQAKLARGERGAFAVSPRPGRYGDCRHAGAVRAGRLGQRLAAPAYGLIYSGRRSKRLAVQLGAQHVAPRHWAQPDGYLGQLVLVKIGCCAHFPGVNSY